MRLIRLIRPISIFLGCLLMAGCSREDETVTMTVARDAVPITFEVTADPQTLYGEGEEEASTRAGEAGEYFADPSEYVANNLLFHTGFGLFMGHLNAARTESEAVDMMYNQQVEYSFLADKEGDIETPPYADGYWSYSPLKYWPGDAKDIAKLFFCAYAPYVTKEAADADAAGTGITGISGNDEKDPYIIYTWSDKYNETVDLMWSYCEVGAGLDPADVDDAQTLVNKRRGSMKMTLHHALARLRIQVKAENIPAGKKVLLRRITLSGDIAMKGKLHLNKQEVGGGPDWEIMDSDIENRTITINSDDSDPDNYCSIDNNVRYMDGYEYGWHKDGLTTTEQDVLFDYNDPSRKAYIYLIPQENALELTPTVDYTILPISGDPVHMYATPTGGTITVPETGALKGNQTYNLIITLTVPTL